VHEELGGGTTGTADPNWPKGCSMTYTVMVSIKLGGKRKERGDIQSDGICLPK